MMKPENIGAGDAFAAGLVMGASINEEMSAPAFSYDIECIDKDGNLKWRETIHNLVTTEGKNDILDKYFAGSAYTAAWFLGLKGTGSAAVGDTLASHAGWTEATPYTGNRPTLTFGTGAAAGSKSASQASISITAAGPTTVAGAFMATVNTGTAGKLYSAGDFAASRSVVAGDTLNVTPTATVS